MALLLFFLGRDFSPFSSRLFHFNHLIIDYRVEPVIILISRHRSALELFLNRTKQLIWEMFTFLLAHLSSRSCRKVLELDSDLLVFRLWEVKKYSMQKKEKNLSSGLMKESENFLLGKSRHGMSRDNKKTFLDDDEEEKVLIDRSRNSEKKKISFWCL